MNKDTNSESKNRKKKTSKTESSHKIKYIVDEEEVQKREKQQYSELKQKRLNTMNETIKEDESKMIHKLADVLFHNQCILVTCKKSEQNEKYSITEGNRYELLAVDFREDGNYVLMREMNEQTQPLFDGDYTQLFNYEKKMKNFEEFLRRGFIYNNEDFLVDIHIAQKSPERETSQELLKKVYENIIQIPISVYIECFDELMYQENTYQKTYDISINESQTMVKIEYTGTIRIKVKQNEPFPMTIKAHSSYENMIYYNYVFNGNEEEFEGVKMEFNSEIGSSTFVNIIFDLPKEIEMNQRKIVTISIENEKNVILSQPVCCDDHNSDNPKKESKTFDRCLFCKDTLDGCISAEI